MLLDQAELLEKYKTLRVMVQTPQLRAIMTIIRDRTTKGPEFVFYADRAIRLLLEDALNDLGFKNKVVNTPVNDEIFEGVEFENKICGVSIIRSGESMEKALREVCRAVKVGKLLIQRDEVTLQPNMYYVKLPSDIAFRKVLLMDNMLATGGSSIMAIQALIDKGVKQQNIIFVNLVAAPEGLIRVLDMFPSIRVVTAAIDRCCDERGYICPGVGDFGDRYFGTNCASLDNTKDR